MSPSTSVFAGVRQAFDRLSWDLDLLVGQAAAGVGVEWP
jgi:hypothetical protein